jgi:hypothetical protein
MMNISQMLSSLSGQRAPTVAADKPLSIDISGAVPVPTGIPNADHFGVLKGGGGGFFDHIGDLFHDVTKGLKPLDPGAIQNILNQFDGIFHHHS